VHLVDVSEYSGRDPVHDFEVIMTELESFSESLAHKPMFVVASKIDVAQDTSRIDELRDLAENQNLPFFEISSVTGAGIDALKFAMAEAVLEPLSVPELRS
jgi:GTP-binding protein